MGRPPVTVGSSHTRVTEPAAVQLATLTPVGAWGGAVMEQLFYIYCWQIKGNACTILKDMCIRESPTLLI